MKIRISLIVTCFLLAVNESNGQSKKRYIPVDKEYLHSEIDLSRFNSEIAQYKTSAVNVTSYLPKNFVKDGTVDYTDVLQELLDTHEVILLPNFPLLVSEKGLKLRDRSKMIFDHRSELVLKPNDKTHHALIKIIDIKDVIIFNPNLTGDRDLHKGTTGQWGMGILIQGSEKVRLINPKVSGFWGDGIYIGPYKNRPSKEIVIENAMLDYNRRNGISITSVDGLIMNNPVVANTFGQSPMAGIDIEPNSNADIIDNIIIRSPVTFHNSVYGLVFSLNKLVGKTPKTVKISVQDHINVGSKIGLRLPAISGNSNTYNIGGTINITNSTFYYPVKNAINPINVYESNIKLTLKGIKIIRKSKHGKVFKETKWIDKLKINLSKFPQIRFDDYNN